MKTQPVPPYLLPGPEAVEAEPWQLTDDGSPLPERLIHWDPQFLLRISRSLTVDLSRLRREAELNGSASLAITSSWYSSRTRLRGPGTQIELGTSDGQQRIPVDLVIPGPDAGGRLTIRTAVVLAGTRGEASPLAASRRGAILWRDETLASLEGSAARFPVAAVDFGATASLPSKAGWMLEWDLRELDAPLTGALRLLVNSGRDDVRSAVMTGTGDPASKALRSFILLDVARKLVHGALRSDSFLERPEGWPPDSLGRMLTDFVAQCWPDRSPATLRARLDAMPERLEAELQAILYAGDAT